MKKIIFATGNQDKMREVREIMSDLDAEILSMGEAGIQIDIVEDGVTFQENARIKAAAVARGLKGAVVLADDSGLEVDALNREPGIYSARYLGEGTPYEVKNQTILSRLEGVPKEGRTARFVCAIAAVFPDGESCWGTWVWLRSDFLCGCLWLLDRAAPPRSKEPAEPPWESAARHAPAAGAAWLPAEGRHGWPGRR